MDYRLTTPVATSAFTYYHKVLELDPEHAEAIKGIDNIADIYHRLAKSAEKDRNYDKALQFANSAQYQARASAAASAVTKPES